MCLGGFLWPLLVVGPLHGLTNENVCDIVETGLNKLKARLRVAIIHAATIPATDRASPWGHTSRVETAGVTHPPSCAMSYDQLMQLAQQASANFGAEFDYFAMRDMNDRIINRICAQTGRPYALQFSLSGLRLEDFVTHVWDTNVSAFVASIRSVHEHHQRTLNLGTCAAALIQSNDPAVVVAPAGASDTPREHSPWSTGMHPNTCW